MYKRQRNDHQVNIRGFRIELGEIESQLRKQDEIEDAVVVAYEDEAKHQQLVGYVVPATGQTDEEAFNLESVRRVLKRHLSGVHDSE